MNDRHIWKGHFLYRPTHIPYYPAPYMSPNHLKARPPFLYVCIYVRMRQIFVQYTKYQQGLRQTIHIKIISYLLYFIIKLQQCYGFTKYRKKLIKCKYIKPCCCYTAENTCIFERFTHHIAESSDTRLALLFVPHHYRLLNAHNAQKCNFEIFHHHA